ncbi:bifunctional DNA primase/polymerase [Streptomyces sp. NPDC101166]|uniref:bifunctional DNA primase/polymerase n=1 Tax=Streptomyces sp. NPDC101166 TaxID=3366120 RepID=UPI00381049BA
MHPLLPGRKTPLANCTACRAPGHSLENCPCLATQRWCHGFHAATVDRDRIDHWWRRNPRHGVGVSCGPAGLLVIDVDAHSGPLPERNRILPGIEIGEGVDLTGLSNGFHTLAVLAALRGVPSPAEDTSTLRVRTPSGGLHVWYRVNEAQHWRCSSGNSAGRALAWQVDVRAHGGYIVAPGTHTSAGAYEVLGEVRDPAPLPSWLAAELERTGHRHVEKAPAPAARRVPPRAQQAVRAAGGGREQITRIMTSALEEVSACGRVRDGAGFSEVLNRAAYTFGGLVAAGFLVQDAATRALTEAAHAARPGQERRSMQIIASGMSAGLARPLTLGRLR